MKIISTNIAKPVTFKWNGNEVTTGLFKQPVEDAVFLGQEDVQGDHVIDRRYHGGKDKACYLYSSDHYEYWKMQYPHLDWQWGMFGENLTVSGLNEYLVRIGDVFRVGEAVIQATQPRQPCSKLAYRFGSQKIVKQFAQSDFPGFYVRIIKEGYVSKGDTLSLMETNTEYPTIKKIFNLLFVDPVDQEEIAEAISNPFLAESCKRDLKKKLPQSSDECQQKR